MSTIGELPKIRGGLSHFQICGPFPGTRKDKMHFRFRSRMQLSSNRQP